ncbi:unnamed protein product [Effrenium voratum]|uniref:Uncharacterized protein n=1 Tax=Effrenium voratum TaxID=2562239 RepID=A0AA36J2Z7_9DINO|nr:unnamed protein product [Effrenium voratum]
MPFQHRRSLTETETETLLHSGTADGTTWGSSLQVLTSRLRVSSTPISACGSEESC